MHWGAGREGPQERSNPRKQWMPSRGFLFQLFWTGHLCHGGHVAHGPVSSGEGTQLLRPQGRERWAWVCLTQPQTVTCTHQHRAEAKPPQTSQHNCMWGDLKRPDSSFLPSPPSPSSRGTEMISPRTEGKPQPQQHPLKEELAFLTNPGGTRSALRWRASSGLTAPRGATRVTRGTGDGQLVSPSHQACSARHNSHLGLWQTRVLASQFPCTNAFVLCSAASTSAAGAESITHTSEERGKNCWGFVLGFLATCCIQISLVSYSWGKFLLLSACKAPTQGQHLPLLQSLGHPFRTISTDRKSVV